MSKTILFTSIFLVLLASCQPNLEESADAQQNYFELINKEMSGDLAYRTTSYVEKYWRVVGNSGFDSSIYEVVRNLKELGYVLEEKAALEDVLIYRVEKRPLEKPTWEPVDASVTIAGEDEPLLQFVTNRNMIAINSYSTPKEGVNAEVVYVEDIKRISEINVKGKIVFAEARPYRIYKNAINEGGAIGVMTYNNPSYLQPEKNTTSIQFRSIPLDEENKSWCIALSYAAKEALKNKLKEGAVKINVAINTKIYASEELTVVAEVRGSERPHERLVFSAHVQEPGANDNATGVGVALEMAAVTARLVRSNTFMPKRTLTFLWGDEIISTRRYVKEDSTRASSIKWGISLDMVGENTEITGGSFLIEKMPDPSAIWTRGKDQHTEWGAGDVTIDDMKPHYLNDFVTNRFMEQGARTNWKVKTNPFEGGSDHVPFLDANIPGVLFWHFTDQFYHTDNDRLDKVSKSTMKNVGTSALISAYTLLNADESTAKNILEEVKTAGIVRLKEELVQSQLALADSATLESQVEIIRAWEAWYAQALSSCSDLVDDKSSIANDLKAAQIVIRNTTSECINNL
jgi:Zn-dependent M28 family amino/carboxypeptidase